MYFVIKDNDDSARYSHDLMDALSQVGINIDISEQGMISTNGKEQPTSYNMKLWTINEIKIDVERNISTFIPSNIKIYCCKDSRR